MQSSAGQSADQELPAIPPGVGRTALGVARIRATESARADRLFDDPFAAAFAAAAPADQAPADQAPDGQPPADGQPPGAPGSRLGFHVVIRTRFYDDYLLGAAGAGCGQVVLVAAGLDCRAFRLDWPGGLRLFELDQPDVLDFKEAVLAGVGARPRCQRQTIPVDLRGDWPAALTGAGFDPAQPTAWLVEGLLIYLSSDQAARLLTEVGTLSAPDSRLALERGHAVSSLISETQTTPRGARLAALWQGGLGEDNAAWLEARGWRAVRHGMAEVAAGYGRPAPDDSRSGFITASRGAV
ncbi:MAG TPA: SAM-dependent methyltransferase [Streptosporangiaceae bacterium]|nr:SAM-dependent methyltransferase [Streptosporangiaceae bacterium]